MTQDPGTLLELSDDELYLGLEREVAGAAAVPQSLGSVVQKGKHAFDQFAAQFRPAICGVDGPREGLGKLTRTTLVEAIATAILTGNVPVISATAALYVAVLIVRMGLNTYCEGFSADASPAPTANPR